MTPDATAPETNIPIYKFESDAKTGQIFNIYFKNLFLKIITLWIYSPWAKVNIRRYMCSHVKFMGSRFEYIGTGKELFTGIVLISVAILAPILFLLGVLEFLLEEALNATEENPSWITVLIVGQVLVYHLLAFLWGAAVFRSLRYRLNRITWRGIRGHMAGDWKNYGALFLGFLLLNIITLGLTKPITDIKLWSYKINNAHFGTEKFHFQGTGKHFYPRYLFFWLLIPLTFGVSWYWYKASLYRYLCRQTKAAGFDLNLRITGSDLAGLMVGNWIIMAMTFYLGRPIVWRRNLEFLCQHLLLRGNPDMDEIIQAAESQGMTGEGLADALDVDAF